MAPMKFEEQMKDKLDQRKIEPSENAWESIASQIDSGKSSNRGNAVFYYAIAAGFVGVVLASFIFIISGNNSADSMNKVVDTENLESSIENPQIIKSNPRQEVDVHRQNITEESAFGSTITNDVVYEANNQRDNNPNITNNISEVIAGQDVDEPKKDFSLQTNGVIKAKISQLVERVDMMELNQIKVTDAEIDSLLRSAQRDIIRDQLFIRGNTVDAMVLLSQAEDEMDQTFRDQIFDALRDGFMKVRTAVASRNE